MDQKNKKITLAITGASGIIYGLRLLEFLIDLDYALNLIISDNAMQVAKIENSLDLLNLNPKGIKDRLLDFIITQKQNSPEAQRESSNDQEKKLDKKSSLKSKLEKKFLGQVHILYEDNIAANCASGSYLNQGMIVAPCSMGTLANIANGTSHNLISRAADVTLKERRQLLLLIRETPLNTIHLRNMLNLSEMGVSIVPAIPAFYHQPQTIEDQIDFIVGKVLDAFAIENKLFRRWG